MIEPPIINAKAIDDYYVIHWSNLDIKSEIEYKLVELAESQGVYRKESSVTIDSELLNWVGWYLEEKCEINSEISKAIMEAVRLYRHRGGNVW